MEDVYTEESEREKEAARKVYAAQARWYDTQDVSDYWDALQDAYAELHAIQDEEWGWPID